MSPRQPWEDVVDAENAYISARMKVFYDADDGTEQLLAALRHVRGKGMALRLLQEGPVERVMELYEAVFDATTTTHPQVGRARDVLNRLDPGWLSMTLPPLVQRRLDDNPDWEDYRRLAELLTELGQTALLDTLVRHAERSTDPDILEVADDYRRGPAPAHDGRCGAPSAQLD